jgi:hypothetical protein
MDGAPLALLIASAAPLVGCSHSMDEASARVEEQRLIYGNDDRKEYYQIDDAALQAYASRASIALVPKGAVSVVDGRIALSGPSWQSQDQLCPDVAFGTDPAIAFCSGVLVAPDLVLTAGHCLSERDCAGMALLRNFRRSSPGHIDPLTLDDMRFCRTVLAWDSGEENTKDRTDFAWIELDDSFDVPEGDTLAVLRLDPGVRTGQRILSFGYGGGGPVKLDTGTVSDARPGHGDFFFTNLDAFSGMSGAPVLDEQLRVVGIDNRGAPDFVFDAADQCQRPSMLDDDAGVEASTHAFRALAKLCQQAPRRDICTPFTVTGGGCHVSAAAASDRYLFALPIAVVAIVARRRQVALRCVPRGLLARLGAESSRRGAESTRRGAQSSGGSVIRRSFCAASRGDDAVSGANDAR